MDGAGKDRGFRAGWTPLYVLSVLLYVWLAANLPLAAIPFAGIDDGLFIRQAVSLLRGDWLGPYDNLTLAKGPFYPLWIAVNWLVGLPLLVSQYLLYASACWLLVRGLRPWLKWEAAAFILFIILLLNPIQYEMGMLRVIREGLYAPLTVLLAGGVAWWFRLRLARLRPRLLTAAGLGATLAAFWLTREEGVWIMPLLVGSLLLALALDLFAPAPAGNGADGDAGEAGESNAAGRRRAAGSLGLAGLTAATALLGVGAVQQMNKQWYGVADTVEFRQKAFLSAYGALSRVIPDREAPRYVAVPRETLARIYAVSPAAAELRPYLDGPGVTGLVDMGCMMHSVRPCDGEFRAGWFMWGLREAAAQVGHYRSAREARGFYARMAAEIDAACDDGRLSCLPRRRTMAPPFRPEFIAAAWRSGMFLMGMTVRFEAVPPPPDPVSCLVDDCGQSRLYASFLDMTRSTLFFHPPWAGTLEFQRRDDGTPRPGQLRTRWVIQGLTAVGQAYSRAAPWLLGAGLAGFAAMTVAAALRRRASPLWLIALLAGGTALARIGLLAYIDAVAMPSALALYLSPAYPALLVFMTTSILGGLTLFYRGKRDVRAE